MELYEEMYLKIKVENEGMSDTEIKKLIDNECYNVLLKIRDIIRDTGYDDDECFDKIEEIVCLFEKLGSNGGFRHDFG